MKKIFLASLLAFSLALAGCSLTKQAGNQNTNQTNEGINANMANPASVNCEQKGGTVEIKTAADGSQSGVCKFSDGSQCDEWAFFRGECQPDSAQDETSKAKEAIKQLFAQKYNKVLSEITVTISQRDEVHARGSVVFGQGGAGEGGNYLAAKVNDSWQLVYDGNGEISCALVQPYNFPAAMISDCYSKTADWQTYKNDKLGFEIQYPQGWVVNQVNRQTGADDPNGSVVVLWSRADYKNFFNNESEGFKEGVYNLTIEYNDKKRDGYLKDPSISLLSFKPVVINEVSGTQDVFNGPYGEWTTIYLVKNGINYSLTSSAKKVEEKEVINQIISTFKFQ